MSLYKVTARLNGTAVDDSDDEEEEEAVQVQEPEPEPEEEEEEEVEEEETTGLTQEEKDERAKRRRWDKEVEEQHFIKHVLAFFAASDGIVLENLGLNFSN